MSEELERLERIEEVAEKVERIATIVSHMLSVFMIMAFASDMLGINIFALFQRAITAPWRIPWEAVYRYAWLWRYMMYGLFTLMLVDQGVAMYYQYARREPPPRLYALIVSGVTFILSTWLALVLRYVSLYMISFYATISFFYLVTHTTRE